MKKLILAILFLSTSLFANFTVKNLKIKELRVRPDRTGGFIIVRFDKKMIDPETGQITPGARDGGRWAAISINNDSKNQLLSLLFSAANAGNKVDVVINDDANSYHSKIFRIHVHY